MPEPTFNPVPIESNIEARRWAMICHLTALCAFIPFGNIIIPLTIWLSKKETSPFIDQAGKEVINFQISMMTWAGISFILCLVLIGFVFLWTLLIVNVVCIIVAAIKAYDGYAFRYPITIRFIK